MMKKTLCILLALALIAQICAKPTDDKHKGKGAENAKGDVEKKANGAGDKVTKAGKGMEDQAKEYMDNASGLGKSHGGEQGSGPMTKMINEMETTGEKFMKAGGRIMTSFTETFGM